MKLPPIPPGSKWFYKDDKNKIWFKWPDGPEQISDYTKEEWAVCPWRYIFTSVANEEWCELAVKLAKEGRHDESVDAYLPIWEWRKWRDEHHGTTESISKGERV